MSDAAVGLRFDQLSDDAKQIALAWHDDQMSAWGDYSDRISELFALDLEQHYDLPHVKVDEWSLGYCQSDKLLLTGTIYDNEMRNTSDKADALVKKAEALAALKQLDTPVFVARVRPSVYAKTVDVDWEFDYGIISRDELLNHTEPFDEIGIEIEIVLGERIEEIEREMMKAGYKEIEWMQSEEYLQDAADANDWRFDEDGEFIR